MGVTRLVIGALLSLGIGRHVRSEEVCCPATKIIHSIFEAGPTPAPIPTTTAPGRNAMDVRRLTADDTCVTARADAISTWTAAASFESYELQGETLIETDFTRFVYDMSIEPSYWTLDDGEVAPSAQKVVVVTLTEAENLSSGWEFNPAAGTGVVCESDVEFVGKDMSKALKNKSMIFLILAAPDAKDSWTTWFDEIWTAGFAEDREECGFSGCLVAVGDRTGGELVDDVHTALKLVDFGGENPFATCSPCGYTAPADPTSYAHTVLPSSVFTLLSLAVLANVM